MAQHSKGVGRRNPASQFPNPIPRPTLHNRPADRLVGTRKVSDETLEVGGWELTVSSRQPANRCDHVARGTRHAARGTRHVARRTWHVARRTSHVARGTSHVARRTWHVARRTWHVARGTWHVARGTWHVARRTWHAARATLDRMTPCILFIFAHPDDESFSGAGTAMRCADEGVRTVLVTATRGQRGSVGDPPLCTRDELGAVREQELREAAAIVGFDELHVLDYVDKELSAAPAEDIRRSLVMVIRRTRPSIVFTFDPDGMNAHPDHIAISR